MDKYLKDRSYYENIYNHEMIRTLKGYDAQIEKNKENGKVMFTELRKIFDEMDFYEHRDKTIQEWMDRDMKKDDLYENSKEPFENIRCKLCNIVMSFELKQLYDGLGGKIDRILFIYRCKKCRKGRAFFHIGEEYEKKQEQCKKCGKDIGVQSEYENEIPTKNYSCENCGDKYKEEVDFHIKTDENNAGITQKDIEKYGYTKDRSDRMWHSIEALKNIPIIHKEIKETKENKKYKDIIEKLEKLNLFQLEKMVNKKLEKDDFSNFKITNKGQEKSYMKCEFEVYSTGDFGEKTNKNFDKLLSSILSNSNWKIQDNKTSEKLGILNGVVYGYDIESDLIELVKKRMK